MCGKPSTAVSAPAKSYCLKERMPSLACKGGVGEGFAVVVSAFMKPNAQRYNLTTLVYEFAEAFHCFGPSYRKSPPYPPLVNKGRHGVYDKQQFARRKPISTSNN